MLKKHKQFIRVFAIFLVLVIFANIVIPNISFASSYYDLKALVTEIENDQTLASTVYTNFLYSKDPRPTKEVYGDEYVDAMTKWLAVALIPEKDRSTKIKNAFIESEPYLNENLKAEDIDDTYYLNAYNEIKKTKDTYDKAKDEGKSDIDASNEAGKDLNDTMTDKVQQDVQDKHDMATGKGNYDIDDGGTSFIKDGVGRNINETINIFLAINIRCSKCYNAKCNVIK